MTTVRELFVCNAFDFLDETVRLRLAARLAEAESLTPEVVAKAIVETFDRQELRESFWQLLTALRTASHSDNELFVEAVQALTTAMKEASKD